ncbi:Bacterial alpha-L-rhamnosidase [Tessaracoccus rhinocerotis]|uniref:alpha-L-rhamnosidase n=1 Tax=Tessaracoccus rhinocerotis TaxID=1689449 RepID=A0A553JZ18_9ACTN|nr:family 78 glycoside hydrolase catalytic domain [Tessaracoccus rhinocerotis]TRY17702.1 Bacterial alpha-L-rhamnosidase [Tessaracoccus rhinocerotis]
MSLTAVPSAPQFEHRTRADRVLGLGSPAPRLSWTVTDASPDFVQTAYEVETTRGGQVSTHRVSSPDQVLVPWPGETLASREAVSVRVRVAAGESWGPWGPVATAEAGLLSPSDWTAAFISPLHIGAMDAPAPVLSRRFTIPRQVASARLYATAHGIYEASLNGRRVDDTVLAPGWTSYDHRLRYHAYDVTHLLQQGENELSALIGNGWYRGWLGYLGKRALYGDRLAMLAQLEVTLVDGTVVVVGTDETWCARESEVIEDDLYNGQTTDLRRLDADLPTSPVEVVDVGVARLVAPEAPPIRPLGTRAAEAIWASPSGRTLVDFGQNAVGWVRLRVRGLAAGQEVRVRHAEVLEDDELGTRPLRAARATDTWVMAGPDEVVLEPSLTIHGFRYAEVTGVPLLRAEDIDMVLVGTDLERTGWFSSSHDLINRLHENVVWSTLTNFVDIPTDCPQRDERLGWTGDIQVFGPTALYLYGTAGLLTTWLSDLAVDQYEDGRVPHVVPDLERGGSNDPAAAAWGDAAVLVPWQIYQATGDVEILRRQLPSMRAWVDHVTHLAGPSRLWDSGFQFGDWLDPTAPPESPGEAKAASELVATAHLVRSARIVARTGEVLGQSDVASQYGTLADEVQAAFVAAYVTPSGRLMSEAQTAYAVAIVWDLLPTPEQRSMAGRRLADLVRTSGFRIATGFVGTPLVCDALAATGHLAVAHRLVLQTQCPSWLYPVTMGATTVWERWDSMLPDGSINPGEMTSFNHYALGAIADWLHRSVAGLAPSEPGWRRVTIKPQPPITLAWAEARHESSYGLVSSRWERSGGQFLLEVTLPAGVTADVWLPGHREPMVVHHGRHSWSVVDTTLPSGSTDFSTSGIRALIDDEATWREVVSAAIDVGVPIRDDIHASSMMAPFLDLPAADVVDVFSLLSHRRFGPEDSSYRDIQELVLGPDRSFR